MSANRRSAARPPRRFAPPSSEGGEIRVGYHPALRATPPRERGKQRHHPSSPPHFEEGAREAGGVWSYASPHGVAAPSSRRSGPGNGTEVVTTWLPPSITESTHGPETDAASFSARVRRETVLGSRDDIDRTGIPSRIARGRSAARPCPLPRDRRSWSARRKASTFICGRPAKSASAGTGRRSATQARTRRSNAAARGA